MNAFRCLKRKEACCQPSTIHPLIFMDRITLHFNFLLQYMSSYYIFTKKKPHHVTTWMKCNNLLHYVQKVITFCAHHFYYIIGRLLHYQFLLHLLHYARLLLFFLWRRRHPALNKRLRQKCFLWKKHIRLKLFIVFLRVQHVWMGSLTIFSDFKCISSDCKALIKHYGRYEISSMQLYIQYVIFGHLRNDEMMYFAYRLCLKRDIVYLYLVVCRTCWDINLFTWV